MGTKTLTFTVSGQNGCNTTSDYFVYVGNTAGGGLGNPGNTYDTAPFTIGFPMQAETYNNTPGTQYIFDFGDGNTFETFELPPQGEFLWHTYTECSTTLVEGNYGFKATCKAINACNTIETTVWPINVSCMAEAGFGIPGGDVWGGNGVDTLVTCNTVTFSNASTPGFFIFPNGQNFSENTVYSWNFGDPESGDANTSNEFEPTHTFTNSNAWYTVTLSVYTGTGPGGNNNSGIDVIEKHIYVQGQPNPQFSLDAVTEACVPVIVTPADQSPAGAFGEQDYLWQIQPSGGWVIDDNSTSTPTITFIEAGDYQIRLTLTNSCGTETSDWQDIFVPGIENNFIETVPTPICSGFVPATLFGSEPTGGGQGAHGYEWQQSTAPFTNWEPADNVNNEKDYDPPELEETTRFRRIAFIADCISTSDFVAIRVDPVPSVTNEETSKTICSGESVNFIIETNIENTTFSWVVSGHPQIVGGADGAGPVIDQQLTNNSNQNRTIIYTITPEGPPDTNCLGEAFNLEVTVRPVIVNESYADKEISAGTSTVLDGALSGGTGNTYIYSWTPVNKLQPGQNTLPNPQTVILDSDQQYVLTVTDEANCSKEIIVNVITTGQTIAVSITTTEETICENIPVVLTAEATGGGGDDPDDYTYSWSGLPANHTFLDPPVNRTVELTPENLGNNVYSVNAYFELPAEANNSITITVNETPGVDSPLIHNMCSGNTVSYNPASDVPNTTFLWTSNNNSCIAGNSSSGEGSIDDELHNNCPTVESIMYTITPLGEGPSFCEGEPEVVEIVVNPVVHVTNAINSQIVVSGEESEAVIFQSNVAGAGFTWTSQSTCEGQITYSEIQGTGLIPAQIITINDGGPDNCDIIYTVIPSINNCAGPSFIYTIEVKMAPTVYNVLGGEEICNGETAVITLDGSQTGVSYQLLRNDIPVMAPLAGNNQALTWVVNLGGVYTVLATNTNSGVSELMDGSATVILHPLPGVYLVTPQGDKCSPVVPGLSGSELDITYTLIRNGQFEADVKPGTGMDEFLLFEQQSLPGDYTVLAVNDNTQCARDMQGILSIHPMVEEFSIFPAGILCVGVALYIEASENGIEYQLWLEDDPVGEFHTGDGGPVYFEPASLPGQYRVFAKDPVWGCDAFFSEIVHINPKPASFDISPEIGCPGTEIVLSGWESGVEYWLHFNDLSKSEKSIVYGPVTGTYGENTLSFGKWYDEGIYHVEAVSSAMCEAIMASTTSIKANPNVFSMMPNGAGCGPRELSLEGSEAGVVYRLYRNNNFIMSEPGNTDGSMLSFGMHDTPGIYSIIAKLDHAGDLSCTKPMNGSYEIKMMPASFNLAPYNTTLCDCVDPVLEGSQEGIHYYLENLTTGVESGPFTASNGNPVVFDPVCDPGEYKAYAIDPAYPSCTKWMPGTFTITQSPLVFNLYGPSPPEYCQGNEGVILNLDNSQTGVEYQLYKLPGIMIGPTKEGANGEELSWENITAGEYYVKAWFPGNDVCVSTMNNNVVVEELPSPELLTLRPLANPYLCPPVGFYLTGTETNVNYVLTNTQTGEEWGKTGNGGTLYFDPVTDAGQYLVIAHKGDCQKQMTGVRQIEAPPVKYNIYVVNAGKGDLWCTDDEVEIGLDDSDNNVTYELHRFPPSGLFPRIVDGDNNPLTFGVVTMTGTYRIKAIDDITGCTSWMNGQTVINKPPIVYNITVNGSEADGLFCPGVEIGLSGSEIGVFYYLVLPDENVIEHIGAGISFNFGIFVTPGDYMVYALDPATACNALMNGSITLLEGPEVYNLTAPGETMYCEGNNEAVELRLNYSDFGVDYQLYKNNASNPVFDTKPGQNNPLSWVNVSQHGPGDYFVIASLTNDPNCFEQMEGIVSVNEVPLPTAQLQGSTSICKGKSTEVEFNLAGFEDHHIKIVYSANGTNQPAIIFAADEPHVVTVSPAETTVYEVVSVELVEFPHCVGTDISGSFEVVVHPLPEATFTINDETFIVSETYSYCHGEIVNVVLSGINLGQGPLDITYRVNNGLPVTKPGISTGEVFFSNALNTGTHTFEIAAVTDNNGCEAVIYTDYIVIIEILDELLAGDLDAGDNQLICFSATPLPIIFDEPIGGSGDFHYQWQVLANAVWEDIPGEQGLEFQPPQLFTTTTYRLLQRDSHCDPLQQVETAEVTVAVFDELLAGVVGTHQAVCYGETPETLVAAAPTGGSGVDHNGDYFSYQWLIWNGTEWKPVTSGTGTNTLEYSPPALYETTKYRLRQFDNYCDPAQQVITDEVIITVDPLPVANAGPDATICELGFYVLQQASALHYEAIMWEIIEGNGEILQADIEKPTYWHYPDHQGLVTSTLLHMTAYGKNACAAQISTSTTTIHVDPLPLTYAGEQGEVCYNVHYDLIDTGAEAWHYSGVLWEIISGQGSITSPGELNASYVPGGNDAGKTVVLSLTAFGSGTCEMHQHQSLITIDVLEIPFLTFSINNEIIIPGNTYDFCLGTEIELKLSEVLGGLAPFEIEWVAGIHSGTSTSSSPEVIFIGALEEGVHELQIISIVDYNACIPYEILPINSTIQINPLPEISCSSDFAICIDADPFVLDDALPAGGEYDGNGVVDGAFLPAHAGIGNHEIIYTYTDANGCINSCIFIITVNDLPAVVCPYDLIVCLNAEPILLAGAEPVGGEYTGAGVEGGIFSPALAGVGNHEVTYTFIDDNGCTNFCTFNITVKPLPEAFAGYDTAICENGQYHLSGSVYNDCGYVWSTTGDGSFSDLHIPEPVYHPGPGDIIAGVVTLCLTALPCPPCDVSMQVVDCFVLAIHPLPEVNAGEALVTCVNSAIQLPIGHAEVNYSSSILWSVKNPTGGGLLYDEFTLQPTYVPAYAASPYFSDAGKTVVLALTAEGQNACAGNFITDELEIKVGAELVASFRIINNLNDTTACEQHYTYFKDLTDYGLFLPHPEQEIDSHTWRVNGVTALFEPVNDRLFRYIFDDAGTYDVSLAVTTTIDDEEASCESTNNKIVIINPLPVADFDYRRLDHCSMKTAFWSIPITQHLTELEWQFPGGFFTHSPNPVFEFESSGYHDVSLRVTNLFGCINHTTKTLQVEPVFDFSMHHDHFCFGDSTTLYVTDILPVGNTINQYVWNFNHTNQQQYGAQANKLYENPGIYNVSLTATDESGCKKTKTMAVEVPRPLNAEFIVYRDCDLEVEFYVDTLLNLGASIVSWTWDFGDGSEPVIYGGLAREFYTYIYDEYKTYVVSLKITDIHGCEGLFVVDDVRTICLEHLVFLVPNALAPDDPNTDLSEFLPKGNNIKEYHFQIFDLRGTLLWETTELENDRPVEAWNGEYKGNPLPQGTYVWKAFVRFNNGDVWRGPENDGRTSGTVTIIR